MDKNKRCKTCKDVYEVHIAYLLEEWDNTVNPDNLLDLEDRCNRFKPMDNLELLEFEEERRRNETPTGKSLR